MSAGSDFNMRLFGNIADSLPWTAVNFKMDTAGLDREMQPGKPAGGLRHVPNVVAVAGGKVIEAQGTLLGAIGVSGAPGPASDDVCTVAGIRAIADSLEF